jgi:hypothetical protein
MKNAVSWDVTLCDSCKNRLLGERLIASIIRVSGVGERGRLAVTSNRRTLRRNTSIITNTTKTDMNTTNSYYYHLLVSANIVPSSPNLATVTMEAIYSSETSILTRATQRHIPKDDIPHSHRRENLKFYIALTGWAF